MISLEARVKEFSEKAKRAFQPARVILFGSRARGDWLVDSDYDFLIVSPKFEGIEFLDRIKNAYLKCNADFPAEILCYTPKEFKRKSKQIGIVAEAAREGITL